MANIFYIGSDEKVYGPVSEQDVQGWYASGYFSSDVKFQISLSDRFDPHDRQVTLGELIELNGRTLPFYFSPEKANLAKEQKETMNQLKQEMDALRTSIKEIRKNDQSNEKEMIEVLQSQVLSLVESHSDLLQKLTDLSSKKDTSPEIPQLDKKLIETNKKVDVLEKSIASMKKEISAVNSKCDRNDSKLQKLHNKQSEIDETATCLDKRISELRLSEKSIRNIMTSCEKNVESSSNQLKYITSELSKITMEMTNNKNDSEVCKSELDLIKKNVNAVVASVAEQKKQMPSGMSDVRLDGEIKTDSDVPPREEKDQKEVNKAEIVSIKTENANTKVKPVTRLKDWDAICRELSDDEEENIERREKEEERNRTEMEKLEKSAEEETRGNATMDAKTKPIVETQRNSTLDHILNSRATVPKENLELIENFMQIFRQYLPFLTSKKMDMMHTLGFHALKGVSLRLLEWNSHSLEFIPLAKALLAEIHKVCDADEVVICWYCSCYLFTPVNILDHLVNDQHFEQMKMQGTFARMHAESVQRMLGKLCFLLKRKCPVKRDEPLRLKGEAMYKRMKGDPRLRPTLEFGATRTDGYLNLACAGDDRAMRYTYNLRNDGDPADINYFVGVVKKWFKVEENRMRFLKEYDEHLSTGVPHCSVCEVAFISKDEYYKHVTGYIHARKDHRLFESTIVRLARGTQDWDITM